MKTAIGYVRVSTSDQALEGVSLAAQSAKIRAWCELNDYALLAIHTDAGLSGRRADNRPALQTALAQCAKDTALVVFALSRLARSTRDALAIAETLSRRGADLVSLSERIDTTSAAGKMIFRLMAVLSEFESDQISERTRAAMAYKRGKGQRVGSIPYGFAMSSDGVHLQENPDEQQIVALIHKLRADGLGYCAIARELDKTAYRPRGGKAWHSQTIKNILEAA